MREKTRGRAGAQFSENGQALSKQKFHHHRSQAPQQKVVQIQKKMLCSMPSPAQRIGSSGRGKCQVRWGDPVLTNSEPVCRNYRDTWRQGLRGQLGSSMDLAEKLQEAPMMQNHPRGRCASRAGDR